MNYIYIILFLLGISLGSFYNVVGLRLLNKQSIIKPASHCPKCNKKLKYYELIPIFSYLALKGKCSNCHKKISLIYPIIELLTGLLFCLAYYYFGLSFEFIIAIIISSLLIIIYITDFKEYIILDEILICSGSALIIINILNLGLISTLNSIKDSLIIFIIFYTIKIIGDKIFKEESLGGGDIKLALIIGFVIGIKLGLLTLVLASFIAFPFAVYIILTKTTKLVPFGPFLITALLLIFLYKDFFITLINKILLVG